MQRLREQSSSPDLDEAFTARVTATLRPQKVDPFMHDRVLASLRRGKRVEKWRPPRVVLAVAFGSRLEALLRKITVLPSALSTAARMSSPSFVTAACKRRCSEW